MIDRLVEIRLYAFFNLSFNKLAATTYVIQFRGAFGAMDVKQIWNKVASPVTGKKL